MKKVTLLFLMRSISDKRQVLLALKKRGTGVGKWNGVGGKVDPGESIEEATIRECQEEIGVTPLQLQKMAVIDFRIPSQNFHNVAYVYVATEWEGEPVETEEMAPQWFSIEEIPYKDMWSDDALWFPRLLKGENFSAHFVFDEHEQVSYSKLGPLGKEWV